MDDEENHRPGIANLGRWWQKRPLSYSHPYVVNFSPKTQQNINDNVPILTQGTHDFNDILSREFYWSFGSMAASLRSLLPRLLGGTDEPVKKIIPPEDDGFIPDYSKYISSPRTTTVVPWRRYGITSRSSRAGPPIDTRRGRRGVVGDDHLPPPAYTPEELSTQVTIHAVPGQTINIVTSSTTGLIIDPYAYAN
jgi:hypothetical protein